MTNRLNILCHNFDAAGTLKQNSIRISFQNYILITIKFQHTFQDTKLAKWHVFYCSYVNQLTANLAVYCAIE